jgi:hypothetical protein
MVKSDINKQWKAVHSLIIEARLMAYNKIEHEKIADFLDKVEYLPCLIMEEKDNSDFFLDCLKAACENFNCPRAYREYISE